MIKKTELSGLSVLAVVFFEFTTLGPALAQSEARLTEAYNRGYADGYRAGGGVIGHCALGNVPLTPGGSAGAEIPFMFRRDAAGWQYVTITPADGQIQYRSVLTIDPQTNINGTPAEQWRRYLQDFGTLGGGTIVFTTP